MNTSINLFLNTIHSAMADKERFRMEITREGNSISFIALPMLNDNEADIPEEAKTIRAALSMPFIISGTSIETMATEFADKLAGYGEVRQAATDAYQTLLSTLKDATADAKNTTSNKGKTNKAISAPKTAPIEKVASTAPASVETTSPDTVTPQQPVSSDTGGILNY